MNRKGSAGEQRICVAGICPSSKVWLYGESRIGLAAVLAMTPRRAVNFVRRTDPIRARFSARRGGDKVPGMNAALVIVDMQEVLIPLVWRGEELAERIASLACRARDCGVPVVALQQIGPSGTLFDPESPGTRLTARLDLGPTDVVVRKTATDGFYGTNLAAVLLEWGVDTIVLTGVATDYCVDATARSSLSHGLDVVLVGDGHAPAADGDPASGLSAEQIIDRHNRILSTAVHPGGAVHVCPAAEVAFGEQGSPTTGQGRS